jgi:hypothetical protein
MKERKEAAKEALKAALGKSEISNTKLEEFIEDGAKSAVKSAMSACVSAAESEADAAAKKAKLDDCRSSSAREALSKALGKSDSSEVSKTEVESFVRNAAKAAVADAMKAALEDDSTSEAEKRQAVKQALAQSLGQSEIDDRSFEFFKKKGAQDAIADTMKSCVEAAKLEASTSAVESARAACAGNSAKEALQTALGNKNVTNADVNKFVQQAGKSSAALSRKNCMKAADTDVTEQKKCSSDRTELIETIKASTGKSTVTDDMAEAFVLDGASSKASETVVACASLAGTDTTKLNECKTEAKNNIAILLGKSSTSSTSTGNRRLSSKLLFTTSRRSRDLSTTDDNTISDSEVEEVKLDGAAVHVMDMLKACYDGALDNETKKQECFTVNTDTETTVKEALGKANVTAIDVHQFNRLSQMKALAMTNEALFSDSATSNEEKNAQRKSDMKAHGIDIDVEPLKAHMFSKKVGAFRIATTALSCLKANKSNIDDCNYEQEYSKVLTSTTSRHRRRLSSATEKVGIKREGAEQVLYRQLLANKATSAGLQGVNGTQNIGDQGTYALLRNDTHRHADIERVKSQIVGDYVVDCRKSGETISTCKENAKLMLTNDMKSKLSIDNTLLRSQFDVFQLENSCSGSKCQDDMKAQATQLDITENELKARRYNSAISSAAVKKADCLESGESMTDCDTIAENAFMLLANNLKPDTKTKSMINTLTTQKQNGVVTELKKRKEITSVASYNNACNDAISTKITEDIKAKLSNATNIAYNHQTNNNECNVFISITMSDSESIENVENDAKNKIPTALSVTTTRRQRRLTTSATISSSITVGEVDPPLNVIGTTTTDTPVTMTTKATSVTTVTTTAAPTNDKIKKVENPTKVITQKLTLVGLTKAEVTSKQKEFESAIADLLNVNAEDVTITSIEEVVSGRRRTRRLMSGNQLKITYTVKADDTTFTSILGKINNGTSTFVNDLTKKVAKIYNKKESDLKLTAEKANEEEANEEDYDVANNDGPEEPVTIDITMILITVMQLIVILVVCCTCGIVLYCTMCKSSNDSNGRKRKVVRGGKKKMVKNNNGIELTYGKQVLDVDKAEWIPAIQNPMHGQMNQNPNPMRGQMNQNPNPMHGQMNQNPNPMRGQMNQNPLFGSDISADKIMKRAQSGHNKMAL